MLTPRLTPTARRTLAPAVLAAALLALTAVPSSAAFLPANADFNGDGFSDLAIGAPTDSVQGQDAAGAVNVLYGGGPGLTADGDVQFTQSQPQLRGAPERNDRFGAALAAGDFDGDGYGDLAIGVPGEGVPTGVGPNEADRPAAGTVQVLYGSGSGLTTAGSDTWTQDWPGIKGTTGAGDRFGTALAAGDFDGDGRDDLAIGSPGDSVNGRPNAGAVNVLYGRPSGLSAAEDQLWTLGSPRIKGFAGANFRFGAALAANDMSSNGRAELAIGAPGGRISGQASAGAVLVLYGRSYGLSSVDDLWSQDARGIKGIAQRGDELGSALAISDFDRDGVGDLAIGVPLEDVGGARDAGAVNTIHGSEAGLRSDPDRLWTQNSRGIKGVAGTLDRFGSALVAVDFSGNVAGDLAIGVPGESIGASDDAGAVNVLYGDPADGLDEGGDQLWSQASPGINGVADTSDRFGAALTAGDFDADNTFDLAIGVPGERVAGNALAGAVNTIYGSGLGLREDPDRLWTQAGDAVVGAPGADSFGAALASGSR